MKCPKCGYISFDHNQTCPKCKKDISAEQKKLNLPDFRPSPPSLLEALTGETIIQTSAAMFDEGQNLNIDLSLESSGELEQTEGISFPQDLPDQEALEDEDEIQFDLSSDDFDLEEEDNGLFLEPDEIVFGESESSALLEKEDEEDDMSLHLGDIEDEKPGPKEDVLLDLAEDDAPLEIDLEALPLEETSKKSSGDDATDLSDSEMITIVIDKEPGNSKD